jgi:hypothetical protein
MGDDTQVLATLYDALDRDPTSIVVHEMLLDVFRARGDQGEAAAGLPWSKSSTCSNG